jgi:uncharacterized metal-binding protein YceD (DUF177 family)
MSEALRIYVDRLRTQGAEAIQETVAPDVIGVQEKDLRFVDPVRLAGEAYLAQDELVIRLTVDTEAQMSCAICNRLISVPLHVELTHLEPITSFKRGFFELGDIIREAVLLEVPLVAECNGGNCPARGEVELFLKKKKKSGLDSEEGYRPFADLDRTNEY